jgi:hypothetical protein
VLQGVGTITVPVTINGGTISPGNSPGTLTINGNLTFTSGTLLTEIGASASDLLHITGIASFLNGTFAFSFLDGFPPPAFGNDWLFLTADGGVTGWEGLDLSVSGLHGNHRYFITSDGNNLRFNLAAVPEPETYAMLLAGLGCLDSWHGAESGTQRNPLSSAYTDPRFGGVFVFGLSLAMKC